MAKLTANRVAYNVRNTLVSIYLVAMFTIFPLFFYDQYQDIRHMKYYCFIVLTLIMIPSVVGVSIAYLSMNRASGIRERTLLPLNVPDWAMIAFLLFAVISTVISEHPLDAITGNAGRNNGLILLLLYFAVYVIVSRYHVYKEYVLAVFMIGAILVTGLAVINFFYIDPLGIYVGYGEDVIEDFASTIGNKNTIASFVCLALPVASALAVLSDRRWLRIIALVAAAITYNGLLCANSLSGFLGLAAMVMFLLIVSSRTYEHLRRFMLTMAVICLSGHWLRLLLLISELIAPENPHKTFESIPQTLLYSPWMVIPTVVFIALFVIMTIMKKRGESRYPKKVFFTISIVLVACAVLGACGAFVWFSFVDTTTELGEFERLLRFNDRWGTHRGFMWIKGMEEYASFPFIKKLFGSGPDTFYYVFMPHFAELSERFGDSSTNCIHSEYLNYLITQGALGLLSYLVLIGGVFVRSMKSLKRSPIAAVFASAVLCYAIQATVNIYQPLTTPLFILLLSMCESHSRRFLAEPTAS